jgi:hypothetical protein
MDNEEIDKLLQEFYLSLEQLDPAPIQEDEKIWLPAVLKLFSLCSKIAGSDELTALLFRAAIKTLRWVDTI